MKTSFVTGFVKSAMSFGCTEDEAVQVLRNALEHPEACNMFNKLAAEDGPLLSSDELEFLAGLKTQIKVSEEVEQLKRALIP